MTFLGIILILTALLNCVAAVLAWIAKIQWSKEYREAKDEIIRAKEAQISTLKEHIATLEKLNPAILKEWYQKGLEMAKTYISQVEDQLKEAKTKIVALEHEKGQNQKLYEDATNAYNALERDYEEIKRSIDLGSLPTLTTIISSTTSADTLAKTTATTLPLSGTNWRVCYDSRGMLPQKLRRTHSF